MMISSCCVFLALICIHGTSGGIIEFCHSTNSTDSTKDAAIAHSHHDLLCAQGGEITSIDSSKQTEAEFQDIFSQELWNRLPIKISPRALPEYEKLGGRLIKQSWWSSLHSMYHAIKHLGPAKGSHPHAHSHPHSNSQASLRMQQALQQQNKNKNKGHQQPQPHLGWLWLDFQFARGNREAAGHGWSANLSSVAVPQDVEVHRFGTLPAEAGGAGGVLPGITLHDGLVESSLPKFMHSTNDTAYGIFGVSINNAAYNETLDILTTMSPFLSNGTLLHFHELMNSSKNVGEVTGQAKAIFAWLKTQDPSVKLRLVSVRDFFQVEPAVLVVEMPEAADILTADESLLWHAKGKTRKKVHFKNMFNYTVVERSILVQAPPVSASLSGAAKKKPIRTYHSSTWEQWWLDNIQQEEKRRTICETIISHVHTRDFLNATASKRYKDWLYFDDHTHGGVWFNVTDGQFSGSVLGPAQCPAGVPCAQLKQEMPITKTELDPTIFSWFETEHENGEVTRDYIEPLVGHLRHPMACRLQPGQPWLTDRTFIVPPPAHMLKPGARAHYYDAGASVWCRGAGGGSLCFFTQLWEENGITFDRIRAWDKHNPSEAALSYPPKWRHKIHFSSSYISTSADKPKAFVPFLIKNETKKDDYVLFKLDIDHGPTEIAIVNYFLDESNDALEWLDEFVWEQHCNNYIMAPSWKVTIDLTKSIADSYQYFLNLRRRGVRAHSYV